MSDLLKNGNISPLPVMQCLEVHTPSTEPRHSAQCCSVNDEGNDHRDSDAISPSGFANVTDEIVLSCCGKTPSYLDSLRHASHLREIEAETNLELRAELIRRYRFRARCEKSRELIKSVDGVSVTGILVQDFLKKPVPEQSPILEPMLRNIHRQLDAAYSKRRKRRPASRAAMKSEAARIEMREILAKLERSRQSSDLTEG